jgi:hypothetical protein
MDVVVLAGANVDGKVGELLEGLLAVRCWLKSGCTYAIRHTIATNSNGAEPLATENRGLRETPSISSLVEPRQVTIETALAAQDVLESPQVVPVPKEKLGVAVNIGRQCLVERDKVLISRSRLTKLARRTSSLQAFNRVDKSLSVAIAVRVPFRAHAGVGARCGDAHIVGSCKRAERLFERRSDVLEKAGEDILERE